MRISDWSSDVCSSDLAVMFLANAGQETGNIDKGDDWDIECITEANKTSCLLRRLNIQASCKDRRLIGDDSNRAPLDAPKTTDDVACMGGLHFQEVAFVHCFADHIMRSDAHTSELPSLMRISFA